MAPRQRQAREEPPRREGASARRQRTEDAAGSRPLRDGALHIAGGGGRAAEPEEAPPSPAPAPAPAPAPSPLAQGWGRAAARRRKRKKCSRSEAVRAKRREPRNGGAICARRSPLPERRAASELRHGQGSVGSRRAWSRYLGCWCDWEPSLPPSFCFCFSPSAPFSPSPPKAQT